MRGLVQTSTAHPGRTVKQLRDRARVHSFRLNIWDVGGQKMLRSYWRNYYEQTDALLWVVDSADVERMQVGQLAAVGTRCCSSSP